MKYFICFLFIMYLISIIYCDKLVTKCDGETARLRCKKDRMIKINAINFGNWRKHECDKKPRPPCYATSALEIANRLCAQKKSCRLEASTDLFPVNCPGMPKYLQVSYDCV